MELPTYTHVWRIEKRLYRLYDFNLPMPIGFSTLLTALTAFTVWGILLSLLGVPFQGGWLLVLWAVPPGLVTFAWTRPISEGKRLPELIWSYARFVYHLGVYARGRRVRLPATVRTQAQVWVRAGQVPHLVVEPSAPPRLRRDPKAAPAAPPVRHESAVPAPTLTRPTPLRAETEVKEGRVEPAARPEPVSRPEPVVVEREPDREPVSVAVEPVVAEPQDVPPTPPAPPFIESGTTVLVMACAPESGQSTTARALAHVLSEHATVAVVCFTTDDEHGRPALASVAEADPEKAGPAYLTLPLPADRLLHGHDYAALVRPITDRYEVVIVDPPQGTVTPLLPLAEQIVMTTTATQSGDRAALLSTEWLRSAGHELLCEDAVVMVGASDPAERVEETLHPATIGVRAVIAVPWDQGLRTSRPVPTTARPAYDELARHMPTPAPART